MLWFGRSRRRFARSYGDATRDLLSATACLVAFCGLSVVTGLQAAAARPLKIVAFGDSLMAGYMLPNDAGFAPRLEAALRQQGYQVKVVNAGVSGDTTSGGLARLDWSLGDGADAVILELGANDMLRGLDPKIPAGNLDQILSKLKARHIPVLLAGMRATPSLGQDYVRAFDAIYPDLARKYGVPLYPFFLDGIIGDRAQHLPDGLHPNARGVDTIVAHILPSVDALVKRLGGSPS